MSWVCFFGTVLAQPDIGLGTAQNIAQQGGLSASGMTDTALSETIGRYVRFLLGFVGIIFLLLTLYAGFLWMTAGGDEGKVEKSKKILTSSVVGVAILVLSYSITTLIMYISIGTQKPEPYGELDITGPSTFSGCCFVPAGRECWENIGEKICTTDKKGRWFTYGCQETMKRYNFVVCDIFKYDF